MLRKGTGTRLHCRRLSGIRNFILANVSHYSSVKVYNRITPFLAALLEHRWTPAEAHCSVERVPTLLEMLR